MPYLHTYGSNENGKMKKGWKRWRKEKKKEKSWKKPEAVNGRIGNNMQLYNLTGETNPVYYALGLFAIVLPPSLSSSVYLCLFSSTWSSSSFQAENYSLFPSVFIYAFFHGSLFINLSLCKFYLLSSFGVLCLSSLLSLALSVFSVCSSGSLRNNGTPIQSTIAGHKLPSKTVALDPTGFTLYTNRVYVRLIEHPR